MLLAVALGAGLACRPSPSPPLQPAVSEHNHPFFPIGPQRSHGTRCEACHTDPSTFGVFSCTGCHAGKPAFDLLHARVAGYAYASAACYRCHPSPAPRPFGHAGITGSCALCHDEGQPFAALPVALRQHRAVSGRDCSGCHRTSGWRALAAPPDLVHDPARDVAVIGLAPSWAGASIVAVTPAAQALPMSMDHATPALAPATLADCGGCHAAAGPYPGELHGALDRLGIAQPPTCAGCHAAAAPVGFVGPLAPAPERVPPSGEMRHDAVEWTDGAPTTTRVVVADCGVCHVSPSAAGVATWATGRAGAARAAFHPSLAGAALAQPGQCLDCHANGRPAAVLGSGTAALPAGVTFDHRAPRALEECATCHGASAADGFTAWSGGRWHLAGSAAPASCLPCHEGQRPTSTAGWRSAGYAAAPFDYGTNAAGVTHGAGQDCVTCHAGPGTGAWGSTHNWVGGAFSHGPTTLAATTCVDCHASQRPDLQPGATASGMAALLGFDHAVNGAGDCLACHQATVAAGRYASYVDPATGTIPGGDWAGGVAYPGDALVFDPGTAFTVTELTLARAGARITGFTSRTATLHGGMSHASPAIPPAISPGSPSSPDPTGCWRCHASAGGRVTSYANGRFHAALATYAATPGGPVAPLPEPTSGCADCHAPSTPAGIVELAGSRLHPMDHGALFATPVAIGSVTATGVAGLDCSVCHASPGRTWGDGVFHARIGSGTPRECGACHYPLMATDAADVTSGTRYAMAHRSAAVTEQRCDACHATALARSVSAPADAALWQPGFFHTSVPTQPDACLDCHPGTRPAAVLGSATAALPPGVTFDHGAPGALAECATCHGAAAAAGGFTAWSGGRWHLAGSTTPASCVPCHEGERPTSTVGWRSATYAAAPFDYGTNAAGVTHGAGQDCALCHSGPGTGVWGASQNWVGGWFGHGPSTVAATTCLACHRSQRPDLQPGATPASMAALLGFDHAASGTGECFGCHQATVAAGRYATYVDPVTGALPGGDWAGGSSYPGAALVFDPAIAFTVAELGLTRAGAIVTGFTVRTATLHGAMSHVSAAVPAAISPGPAASPDLTGCWRCHTSSGGTVTSYANGRFHAALTAYAATPGGAVTPIAQPTAGCGDCHGPSTPAGVVALGASTLAPMDHGALFASPVTIGSVTVAGVAGLDCSACHASPGGTWADGVFHARIGAATPQDCAGCHYPLMATAAADVTSGTRYAMAHRSPAVTDQRCDRCHATALARSTITPVAATLWQPGAYHASVTPQPTACVGCHPSARPAGVLSSATAALPPGVTFDHGAPGALGDCAPCHASGGAWTGARWHLAGSATPASCAPCHEGERPTSTAGWQSATYAAAPFDYGTNAAGVRHGAGQDCAVCHAGPGTGTWGGTQNWIGGRFGHGPATLAATTCIACHASQRPDLQPGATAAGMAALLGFDHAASGTGECLACHRATVTAGRYATYVDPVTGALPGGDWRGGRWHLAGSAAPASCLPCHEGRRPTSTAGWISTTFAASPFDYGTNPAGVTHGAGQDCALCHAGPGTGAWGATQNWAGGAFGHGPATLAATTCIACHTSQRPDLQPGATAAGMAALLGFDHAASGTGECLACHRATVAAGRYAAYVDPVTGALPGGDWRGGRWHLAGSAAPGSCLPCHEGRRPTSTAGWASTTYAASPFDYGTNPAGVPHGAGQDCALCHAGPGTGAWGSTQNWVGGWFGHGAATVAATTCIACHTSQRPDLQPGVTAPGMAALLGFDHAVNGAGECLGCHQATVAGGTYASYVDPLTGALPGGDWSGGVWYPGAALVFAPAAVTTVTELALTRSGALVTGFTARTGTLVNGMSHVSPAIPAAISPGPAASPDVTGCWRCHTSSNGRVVSYANGRFHPALAAWAATPGGAVTPLPQPTSCGDCHAQTTPAGIVERAGSSLQPMDHGATFASTVTIGGAPASGVAGLDCAACHVSPGVAWADGLLHARVGAAAPRDCAACHYPLMATPAADVASGNRFTMAHRSSAVTDQRCDRCHPSALARSATVPAAAALWQPGFLHTSVTTQPATCADCHLGTRPAAVLTSAASALPAGVVFDHAAPGALGDCASCHAAGAGWAGGRWHLAGAAAPASCLPCHEGERPTSTAAWQSPTYTASPFDYVGAGATAHGAGQDCAGCHPGPGTGAWGGTQNWIGGWFAHGPGTVAATTCIACHRGQRPDLQPGATPAGMAALLGFDHAAAGTGDCFGCHQATVAAGRYVSYVNPATGALPGGDWAGGASYPGAAVVLDPGASFTVVELTLVRSGALVTGFTERTATLYGAMSHVSAAIPLEVHPGPAGSPDATRCWRCHTNTNGTVTTYVDGAFHAALTQYTATPGADATPLPQPTSGCADCHGPSTPDGIVEPAGSVVRPMDHAALFVSPVTIGTVTASGVAGLDCSVCHARPGDTWSDGVFHAGIGAAAPADCVVCHYPLMATELADVASGTRYTMRHRSASIADQRCDRCHAAALGQATSRASAALWRPGVYHAAVAAQPAGCVECHPATRPAAVLTSTTAALRPGVTFDHAAPGGAGECAGCHAAGAAAGGWAAWSGGRWHLPGGTTPASCLPCHEGERPTTTAGWQSATYASAPFDYAGNAAGVTHGAGQDCAVCHAGPGTGAWGSSQDWIGGWFAHGPATVAAGTCIACHMSQRPDLQAGATAAGMAALLGFDHALNGTGDCFGCHQATVAAGRYARYGDAVSGALPGGDWAGGVAYPGATLIYSLASAFTVTELRLVRSGALVTGAGAQASVLHGGMVHVSPAIPAELSPGPASSPDLAACWRCHASAGGAVTSYADGRFHPALSGYSAAPGGPVTPLAQPTSGCADCHGLPSTPTGIVEFAATTLRPMDHAARFAGPATIGGVTATGVAGLDCSACHVSPGVTWADGLFHARIGAATPQDCAGCHYPLMATAAADVASGTRYLMAHRSAVIGDQRCDICHPGALARSVQAPLAPTLWQPGAYHASVGTQPGACLDCHAVTAPAASTQSTAVYAFTAGGTATNGGQWMSHAARGVAGVDCAACHAADARPSGGAWSRATAYHARAPQPAACASCHGLANGNGAVAGTGNNLPSGVIDSSTQTTASNDPATGVPAGTRDRIDHGDLSVASRDCGFCHWQAGPSTTAGVAGREWAQARFHGSFSAAAPLVTNGATARCSHCHLNLKPGPAFTRNDHSAYADAAGTQDCAQCHAWPGTGTPASPNWLGGGNSPQFITVGGFLIPNPPASAPVVQGGIPGLPHPDRATGGCITCHAGGGAGGTGARGYDHASPLIAAGCSACHEAGSHLVGTVWNGAIEPGAGAGDTRPVSLASIAASYKGNTTIETAPNHFYLDRAGAQVDCSWCHVAPVGVAAATTGGAYLGAWAFTHPPELDPPVDVCYQCHAQGRPPPDPAGPGP